MHNWLPDAHSRGAGAGLRAALRRAAAGGAARRLALEQALAPAIGARTAGACSSGSGSLSLAVAVPFLWRPLPWKRLLAYSSLEHMGVIALGIGFGTPLALAGVAIHVVGHALAKALGFYAATPLLAHEPRAAGHAAAGIGRTQPALGATLGISLGALAGLPPSPLFVSEVLIVAGGFQAGRPWAAAVAAVLLALGFLGLAHALIETVAGKARDRDRDRARPALRRRHDRRRGATLARARQPPRCGCPARRSSAASTGTRDQTRAAYRELSRLRSPTAGASPACTPRATAAVVRTLLAAPDGATPTRDGRRGRRCVPTIVDLAAAAGWDEREAHDLYGVRFDGHEPLRPLVDHEAGSPTGPHLCEGMIPIRSRSDRSTPA